MGRAGAAEAATSKPGGRGDIRSRATVLFTCIGRRVSLLRSFRDAAEKLRLDASFLGTDTSKLSPALQLCDEAFLVEPTTDAEVYRPTCVHRPRAMR